MLNLGYNYGAQNNGQIRKVTYYTSPGVEDTTRAQNYEYDAWSRLKKAYTTDLVQQGTWRLEWDYDRFGNRRNQTLTGGAASITQPQLNISETTNRITDAGFAYDASGNLTNDALHAYAYDAENRVKTVDSTAATYTYMGATRIKKVVGATTTVYVFSGSKVLAEYVNGTLSKEYVYAGSQLLVTVRSRATHRGVMSVKGRAPGEETVKAGGTSSAQAVCLRAATARREDFLGGNCAGRSTVPMTHRASWKCPLRPRASRSSVHSISMSWRSWRLSTCCGRMWKLRNIHSNWMRSTNEGLT